MPAWLSFPSSHLVEERLETFRAAMDRSYLTEEESSTVMESLQRAAKGDENKLAGVADFCTILIETIEVDKDMLVAAAFHYCSCFSVREKMASAGAHAQPLDLNDFEVPTIFGEEVSRIAVGTAILKKVESLAASVILNETTGKYIPDKAHAENLRSLLLSETADWRSLAIRSSACLYRLRGLVSIREETLSNKLTREEVCVCREALYIYAPLASRLGMHRLKNELERIAFRVLYRRQHDAVQSLYRQDEMEPVLSDVTARVRELLEENNLSGYTKKVRVTARVKEPFSLWKKMLRTGAKDVLDVPDAIALRVILDGKVYGNEDQEVTRARERALCYYVQKLCTDQWVPTENPRFKDYIDRPKANGYQSLHYTASMVWNGVRRPFEIQVRSGEMHRVAEYGLAAHFDYKLQGKRDEFNPDRSSEAYLQSLKAWHWQQSQGQHLPPTVLPSATTTTMSELASSLKYMENAASVQFDNDNESKPKPRAERAHARATQLAPYIEALKMARLDLTHNQVFVFLSSSVDSTLAGRILPLPSGSCIVDALREIERQYGVNLGWQRESKHLGGVDVVHNGVSSLSMTERLSNGDVLSLKL
eukprot:CAMPEP_0195538310 /NCGR_PEP_ID=MMETSP0794_2-20130614/49459_1 /TAXON_ID=515487 /ORGANISM="Stephanopyxis turris, Strain CCMP 815" /LENGTH=592 /DNA_ID=CAMNT_0040672281 /DNA_START=773 /DNA_END=2551 /DNA_ORIENTATION=-